MVAVLDSPSGLGRDIRRRGGLVSDEKQPDAPPDPQGHFAKVPYDWRRPTLERVRARWWNRNDMRLWTPKSYGWGYDLNLYWLVHPREYVEAQRARSGDSE
jgi:hypothetical protein